MRWDPAEETFTDDAEACSWIDRPRGRDGNYGYRITGSMFTDLKGKTVLVTGGGSGMGLAILRRTAETLEQAAAAVDASEPLRWTVCDVAKTRIIKRTDTGLA